MSSQTWAAIIPAYNAAEKIANVISGVSTRIPLSRILVVDDGSTDETAKAVRNSGADLLRKAVNGGKGQALRDGFKQALKWLPDWIICLDADGQHDPEAIPLFQEAAKRNGLDLIVGNRRENLKRMPLPRRFSNLSSSGLLSLRTGMKLPDVQCGYRAIRAEVLQRMDLRAQSYEIEAEMILAAWRLNCKIGWVQIPTIYRGEPSYIRKISETFRFLRVLSRSFYE